MGIFKTAGSLLRRSAIGAGAGAAIGGYQDGFSGMIPGAIGGAAMGAAGPRIGRMAMGKGRTIAGLAGTGAKKLTSAADWTMAKGLNMAGKGGKIGFLGSNLGIGAASTARALETAGGWIGKNASTVNKWGGKALAGAGIASGAMIGSSVINSNRGY